MWRKVVNGSFSFSFSVRVARARFVGEDHFAFAGLREPKFFSNLWRPAIVGIWIR